MPSSRPHGPSDGADPSGVTEAGMTRPEDQPRPVRRGGAGPGRSSSAPAEYRHGDYRGVIVMVIVPVLSAQLLSTMNAVTPFWKWVPSPFTAMLFWFTVEMMLSELKGRFGVCT